MISNSTINPVIDRGGLSASFVPMPVAEAVQLLHDNYGLIGKATRLTTEKDDTFRIDEHSGSRLVLKIANPLEDLSEIDCQVSLLKHIEARNENLPVPRVLSSLSGQAHFPYEDRFRQMRQVRLMSYLEGIPLSDLSSTAQERFEVGKALAKLRLAMADFSHPGDSRILAWDVKHLLHLDSLLVEIPDMHRRSQLEAALNRFAQIEGDLAKTRTQVVHNDFSKSNVVVDRGHPGFVTGIIDFGDAVRTSIAIDVSTALLNQLGRTGDIFREVRDLLRGYLSIADLTGQELSLIPHLVMARVVARALLTTWRARLFPENAVYILRNTEQGWDQLNWFLSRGIPEVSEELQNATA